MQNTLNGGFATALRDNVSVFSTTRPFLQTLSDQTTVGPFALPFAVSVPMAPPLVVSAATSDPAIFPVAGLSLGGSGTLRSLALTPLFGASGAANITLSVADGSLTMVEVFRVAVSRTPRRFRAARRHGRHSCLSAFVRLDGDWRRDCLGGFGELQRDKSHLRQ